MSKTYGTSAISTQVQTTNRTLTQSFTQALGQRREFLSEEATCEYISDMTRELLAMANAHSQSFLAYLLGMAADEARATARRMQLAVEHTN